MRWMGLDHAHLAKFVIMKIKDRDLVRFLCRAVKASSRHAPLEASMTGRPAGVFCRKFLSPAAMCSWARNGAGKLATPLVCLAAHDSKFRRWTPGNVKLLLPPGRAGGTPLLVRTAPRRPCGTSSLGASTLCYSPLQSCISRWTLAISPQKTKSFLNNKSAGAKGKSQMRLPLLITCLFFFLLVGCDRGPGPAGPLGSTRSPKQTRGPPARTARGGGTC